MNRVFIHIGLPKTATSSIQNFLYDNSVFLEQHGYYYLQTGLNHDLKCHHDMVWKLGLHKGPSYVEEDIEKYKKEILDSLREEVVINKEKDLILSSELLSFLGDFKKLDPLLEIFKDKEIQYILNLRRQDRFLESLYQQVVKDGIALTFDEWLQKSRNVANYNVLVTKLLQITSKENIIIDMFDSRIPNLHPTENFLLSLGFDKTYLQELNIGNIRENESLSKAQVNKLQASNMVDPNSRFSLMQTFIEENRNSSIDKVEYLDDEQRKNILNSFHESNLKLIETMDIPEERSQYLFIKEYKFENIKLKNFSENIYIIDSVASIFEKSGRKTIADTIIKQNEKICMYINDFDSVAGILRDIALFFEKEKDIDNAYEIMKEALVLRKNGPKIQFKVKQYKEIIENRSK